MAYGKAYGTFNAKPFGRAVGISSGPSTDLFLPRRRRTELPDRKTERHAYLRRSEVVLMPPTEVTSAFLPNVAVVIRTKIAQSCRSLDAPIFSEGPSVPVCHTRPIQGPLVSPVAHAQKLHASDIEIGIQKMHAQKMPFENGCGTNAGFRVVSSRI